MSEVEEEARAALYRQQEATRYRSWLLNHRVALAPRAGAFAALLAGFEPFRLAKLEAQITEPLEPPFAIEFEDAPYPVPKHYPPLP